MDADELAQAVARLTERLRDVDWWTLDPDDRQAVRDCLAALAEAQAAMSEEAEFGRAAAFLRELRAVTTLRGSPGPLYAAGYFAGIDGVISCLEEPESPRLWLATQKTPGAAGESQS